MAAQRVSRLELGPGEVQSILRTLLYDGALERRERGGEEVFQAARDTAPETTAFTAIPCGVCPVSLPSACGPAAQQMSHQNPSAWLDNLSARSFGRPKTAALALVSLWTASSSICTEWHNAMH